MRILLEDNRAVTPARAAVAGADNLRFGQGGYRLPASAKPGRSIQRDPRQPRGQQLNQVVGDYLQSGCRLRYRHPARNQYRRSVTEGLGGRPLQPGVAMRVGLSGELWFALHRRWRCANEGGLLQMCWHPQRASQRRVATIRQSAGRATKADLISVTIAGNAGGIRNGVTYACAT
jgi:hypothetical protein